MGSSLHALVGLLQLSRLTNTTLIEPAAGSAAASSNFHTACPASDPTVARYQAFGAVYSLPVLAAAGFAVLPLSEFWRLHRCGGLPARSLLPGSWDSNGTCFTCEGAAGNVTVFRHVNAHRIHAGNKAMCGGKPEQDEWAQTLAVDVNSPTLFDACCVRKHDGASSGHYTRGLRGPQPVPPLQFSLPREHASRFIARRGLSGGYVGVHWRSEKDRGWFKSGVDKTVARFSAEISAALSRCNVSKVFLAVDFVSGGSSTHNPNQRLLGSLNAIADRVASAFGAVRFDAKADFPEAVAAQNNMLIAATEATVLIRACEFVPLKRAGSFVSLILRERQVHELDPR